MRLVIDLGESARPTEFINWIRSLIGGRLRLWKDIFCDVDNNKE